MVGTDCDYWFKDHFLFTALSYAIFVAVLVIILRCCYIGTK